MSATTPSAWGPSSAAKVPRKSCCSDVGEDHDACTRQRPAQSPSRRPRPPAPPVSSTTRPAEVDRYLSSDRRSRASSPALRCPCVSRGHHDRPPPPRSARRGATATVHRGLARAPVREGGRSDCWEYWAAEVTGRGWWGRYRRSVNAPLGVAPPSAPSAGAVNGSEIGSATATTSPGAGCTGPLSAVKPSVEIGEETARGESEGVIVVVCTRSERGGAEADELTRRLPGGRPGSPDSPGRRRCRSSMPVFITVTVAAALGADRRDTRLRHGENVV